MDTEILRTFIEVNRTRHFARAADNLYVTQAAVSARIRQLEAHVGARLFTRSRNNIQLTPAGHRLLPHAEAMVANWNRAMLEVGAEEDGRSLVTMGCLPGLREIFLDAWLSTLYGAGSAPLLQIELLNSVALVSRVREQSLSMALLYEPPQARDLKTSVVATLNLLLVSSRRQVAINTPIEDLIAVDWGTSIRLSMETLLDPQSTTLLRVDTPLLAHRFLQNIGGTALLPETMVAGDLRRRRLHLIADSPVLDRPVYLVRNADAPGSPDEERVAATLTGL